MSDGGGEGGVPKIPQAVSEKCALGCNNQPEQGDWHRWGNMTVCGPCARQNGLQVEPIFPATRHDLFI